VRRLGAAFLSIHKRKRRQVAALQIKLRPRQANSKLRYSKPIGPVGKKDACAQSLKPQSMYFLYSFALSLLFFALLPYFAYQALRHGKYAGSFKERMGWAPVQPGSTDDGRETIWLHAVSVGEFLAARALLDKLKIDLPAYRLVVSTTTLTGQTLARLPSNNFDGTFYFPFDWRFSVRRALDRVKPSIVVILETELWPNFLRECRRRDVIVILANGRISERSFRRYRRVRSFIRRTIGDLSLMIMQTEADAERARQLGASRVRVCGNLKYDVAFEGFGSPDDSNLRSEISNLEPAEQANLAGDIDQLFGLSRSSQLIVAGSTAPGEEEILLGSLREVRTHRELEGTRLLVAPRHPERFDEVARLIDRSGFSCTRRSDSSQGSASIFGTDSTETRSVADQAPRGTDVILLDTMGELAAVYRFAAVVFVGGSLVPRGGHNVIEPAAFARPIIVGPHTENFRQIVSDFARAHALVQVDPSALTGEFIRLLSDPTEACAMGERARNILIANRGATECVIQEIKEELGRDATRASNSLRMDSEHFTRHRSDR
jgi:3-deoxy-D-manno-octulosonic-acid transferase